MALTLTLKKYGETDRDLALSAISPDGELLQEVENELCRFVSSDVDLDLDNSDGWYSTNWSALDPEAVYPDQWYLQVSKGGSVVWEGDLDPVSVSFDLKARTVKATFLHKLKRLEHYAASGLLRTGFRYQFRSGYCTSATKTDYTVTLTDPDLDGTTDQFLNHYITHYCKVQNMDTLAKSDQWCVFKVTASTGTTVTGRLVWPLPYDTVGEFKIDTVYSSRTFWIAPLSARILGAGGILAFSSEDAQASYGLLAADKVGLVVSSGEIIDEVELYALTDYNDTLNEISAVPSEGITPTTGTARTGILLTPYNRNKSIADTAADLFAAAGLSASDYEISVTEYDRTLDYLDFSDKSVLEALTELAAVANAVVFATPSKFYFIDRDTAKSGGATKTIDSLLVEAERPAVWEHYHPQVRVDGADDHFYRVRGPARGGAELSVSTDFVSKMATLKEIALRLYEYFGANRKFLRVRVEDDGTAWKLWDTATYDSVNYWVVRVGEPVRSVDSAYRSTITLDLVEKTATATAATAGTGAGRVDTADLDDPIPPLAVAFADAVPYYTVTGGTPVYYYSENNGASYDYPIYFTVDPPEDLWKVYLWKLIASATGGSAQAVSYLDPFTRKKPASAPTTGTTAGGAKGSRTYYVKITYASASGETEASASATQAVAANNLLTVTAPTFPGGVGKCHVYVGTAADALYYQGTISTTGGTWTEPTTALATSGPVPPTQTVHRAYFQNAASTLDYNLAVSTILYTARTSAPSDTVKTAV